MLNVRNKTCSIARHLRKIIALLVNHLFLWTLQILQDYFTSCGACNMHVSNVRAWHIPSGTIPISIVFFEITAKSPAFTQQMQDTLLTK